LGVGDHGFTGKQNMYDASMRAPLIVTGPNMKKDFQIDEFVSLQDIVPTSLEIAGAPKPDYVDFHSLLPMAAGQANQSAYDAVYVAYMDTQRMIINEKYKMIIYPVANVVRLYDIQNDPWETNDLASDTDYKQVMDELFLEFRKLQKDVSDPMDVTTFYENFFAN